MRQVAYKVSLFFSITILTLAGCATNSVPETDRYELLSLRSLPKGSELKDECTCLNEDIVSLNAFAERMNDSKYAVHYHVMSQQKISLIQNRADNIGCNYPTTK